jgi:dihydroneopterin aldolase
MTGEGRPRRATPARRAGASAGASGAASSTDVEITLRAMCFHARVGILEHERTSPQPIELDVTVWCAGSADIMDYRRLYGAAHDVLGAGPIDYLEEVGDRVAERVLADERVREVRVAVRKPHVALSGPLAYAEVVIRRARRKEG